MLAADVGESHRHSNEHQKILVNCKNIRKRANVHTAVPKSRWAGKLEQWERFETSLYHQEMKCCAETLD